MVEQERRSRRQADPLPLLRREMGFASQGVRSHAVQVVPSRRVERTRAPDLPSSVLDRLTLTRSCAPYVRIMVTSELTRFTPTLSVFPPAGVNGRPMISYSPVSSVSPSPTWSSIGKMRRSAAGVGSLFLSWRRLASLRAAGAMSGEGRQRHAGFRAVARPGVDRARSPRGSASSPAVAFARPSLRARR
jgi:hypothetical protein